MQTAHANLCQNNKSKVIKFQQVQIWKQY